MIVAPDPTDRRARLRVGAGAALVLGLVGVGVAVLITAFAPHGASAVVLPTSAPTSDPTAPPDAAGDGSVIYIHILGEVEHPGLYALRDGDRAVDVVAAAGGFTQKADPGSINLARVLTDGEQIVVPQVGTAPGAAAESGAGPAAGAKVNLNTADATALESLPRIGPAMAQRIIEWRTKNGRFTSVEDLLDVTGIGDATFAGLKDLVTV